MVMTRRLQTAEIELRKAALAFAKAVHGPVRDARDTTCAAANRKLLLAARRYAQAQTGAARVSLLRRANAAGKLKRQLAGLRAFRTALDKAFPQGT